MSWWSYEPRSNPSRSEDVADLSALLFMIVFVTVIGLALTVGVTLMVAWALRDSLAPLLGVV